MTEPGNTPELIEDAALDDASGGLLLPAVQKVREAASRLGATEEAGLTKVGPGTLVLGGATACDGSV